MTESESAKSSGVERRELPLRKKLLYTLIINVLLFGLIETSVRVGAYFVYGGSPFFLLYGLRSVQGDANPEGHSVVLDGYAKFPPSRTISQYGLFEEPTPIRINSAGLRGDDFEAEKPEGVYRMAALGGSSTFGFYSRDAYTYPAALERTFADRSCARPPVEVINAGVPHATSTNLAAMLRGELVDYDLDALIVYTGYNDAFTVLEANLAQKTVSWLHEHVLSFVALKALLRRFGAQNLSRAAWARHRAGAAPEYVARQIDLHVEEFEANLRDIASTSEEHGIRLVLVRQPVRVTDPDEPIPPYADRVAAARSRWESGESLTHGETILLIHAAEMDVLDRIAADYGLTVVDNIGVVDARPDFLASYVHLTEEGNAVLADTLFRTLRPAVDARGAEGPAPDGAEPGCPAVG